MKVFISIIPKGIILLMSLFNKIETLVDITSHKVLFSRQGRGGAVYLTFPTTHLKATASEAS